MAEDLKISEMRAWVAQLNEAADAYYNGRRELMTDFEWDALFDKVKEREAETGVVLPDSPTNRVGADDVVGEKEAEAGQVAVRRRDKGDMGAMNAEAFIATVVEDIAEKRVF